MCAGALAFLSRFQVQKKYKVYAVCIESTRRFRDQTVYFIGFELWNAPHLTTPLTVTYKY